MVEEMAVGQGIPRPCVSSGCINNAGRMGMNSDVHNKSPNRPREIWKYPEPDRLAKPVAKTSCQNLLDTMAKQMSY